MKAYWKEHPALRMVLMLVLFVLALVLVVVKFSQKYFKAQQATLGVVNGQVEEVYAGHNVVKAFNREAVVLADFNAANDKLYESAWKSQFLSGLMMPIMNFVGNLGYVAVAIVGSIFAANGVITIGDIQAFIQYVKNFTQPIQQLSQVSNMLQSMAAAAERVFEFLNEPEEAQLADPARSAGRQQRKRSARRPSPPSSSPHTAPLLAADVLTVYEAAQTGMPRDGAPAPEEPSYGLHSTPPSICSRTFPRSPCPPRASRSPAPWSWHNCRRCSAHSAPAARPRRRPPAGKAAG